MLPFTPHRVGRGGLERKLEEGRLSGDGPKPEAFLYLLGLR